MEQNKTNFLYEYNYDGYDFKYGDVIIVKDKDSNGNPMEAEAVFIYFAETATRKVFMMQVKRSTGWRGFVLPLSEFGNYFIRTTDKNDTTNIPINFRHSYDKHNRMPTVSEEVNIPGMLNAWVTYIIVMAIITLFHGRLIGWAFASYIFFDYRKKKISGKGFKD